jgi:phosphoribosylaminoimidazole-succinocarboxamide synthase
VNYTQNDIQIIINNCLENATFTELPGHQPGKVRESYDLPDGRRVMISTDRQSAFDQVLTAVPFKGQVLNQTAMFWFDKTSDICPNHVIEAPDPNIVIAQRLDMLKIEMIVRDYMTGSTETSIWPMYERGERILYGHKFPEGLTKNQKLPDTILTPTTKASIGEHDAPITAEEIVEQGLLSQKQWDELAELSLAIFDRGREISKKNGLILVDTKYEFGLDLDGKITIADEIHTPDSSRFWIKDSYVERLDAGNEPESLDKEFLRLWIKERCDPYNEQIPKIPSETLIEFSNKYIKLYEQVTGEKFMKPDTSKNIRTRIKESLEKNFSEYFKL